MTDFGEETWFINQIEGTCIDFLNPEPAFVMNGCHLHNVPEWLSVTHELWAISAVVSAGMAPPQEFAVQTLGDLTVRRSAAERRVLGAPRPQREPLLG